MLTILFVVQNLRYPMVVMVRQAAGDTDDNTAAWGLGRFGLGTVDWP